MPGMEIRSILTVEAVMNEMTLPHGRLCFLWVYQNEEYFGKGNGSVIYLIGFITG